MYGPAVWPSDTARGCSSIAMLYEQRKADSHLGIKSSVCLKGYIFLASREERSLKEKTIIIIIKEWLHVSK